jgi:RND family efflux transporter MFP subunit
VTATAPTIQEVEFTVEAVGSVEASEEISIPARVSGPVDRVSFKEGDAVTEATTLAEIDVERFRLAEAKAKAQMDRTQSQAALAEIVYKNRLTLYEEGKKRGKEWVTEEQLATWKADLDRAKAELDQARVDWDLARRNHADARVRSPIAGIINKKLVSTGEFVKPETVIATILDISPLHLRFSVPELEASRLSVGQEALFSVRSIPEIRFKAVLFHLGQKADPSTRAVECKAEVVETPSPPDGGTSTVPGRHAALRPGTYASVRIVTGKRKSMLLPETAVLPTDRGFVVYALDGAKAVSRTVKLGLRFDGKIEIVDGLKADDRVVVDGASGLREGAEVEVVEGAAK